MREILFLAHRIPWPADRGDKIRSHHILKRLAQMGRIHVGAFADDERDMGFVAELDQVAASSHVEIRSKPQWLAGVEALATGALVSVKSFTSASMAHWVETTIREQGITDIFVFSGQMAQYVPADFEGRFVMDFVDVDSAKFESYAGEGSLPMRWVNAREGRKLATFEAEVAKRADASLFVSEAEAALFRQRSGAGDVFALGNGIDTAFYDPTSSFKKLHPPFADPLIVFTGQMDYRPNIGAVSDFAIHAMPIIRAANPEATFAIVGRNPTAAVSGLSALPGVQVTGAVDDVRSWLAAADIVVAPLRIARGIQNKVLEAMAMARPVVLSPAAAEGIAAHSGTHFYVEADVEAEARRINELLAEPEAGLMAGQAARAHVVQHYGWAAQLAPLDALLLHPKSFASSEVEMPCDHARVSRLRSTRTANKVGA